MATCKSFDNVIRKMCSRKLTDPEAPLLKEQFTPTEAIAAAVIKKAMNGSTDAVKLIREITDGGKVMDGRFKVDISVVD